MQWKFIYKSLFARLSHLICCIINEGYQCIYSCMYFCKSLLMFIIHSHNFWFTKLASRNSAYLNKLFLSFYHQTLCCPMILIDWLIYKCSVTISELPLFFARATYIHNTSAQWQTTADNFLNEVKTVVT